jgi:hypothetical protein
MGTKADFYCGLESKRNWIGSLYKGGDIWNIPLEILIQVNKSMFEELTIDLLKEKGGSINDNRDKWPWLWSDSRLTDYSYIFLPKYNKVYMSIMGNIFVDPLKIRQGEDLETAHANLGFPQFPCMSKATHKKTEELIKQYGSYFTTTL